jgi:putative oxidoreductase
MKQFASLPLRLGLGVTFIAYGLQKVFGMFGGPGMGGYTQMLSGLGFVPAIFWAYASALTELLGGVCVLIGLGTKIAAAFLFVNIAVAALVVHLPNGFFMADNGVAYTFLIACAAVSLVILGAGKFAVTKKY